MYRERKAMRLKGRYCDSCNIFYPSNRTGWIVECPKCHMPLKKAAGPAKYLNEKVPWKGSMIDSKKERCQVIDTDYLKMAGEIKGFQRQVEFPFYVNGMKICAYVADIVIDHLDGSTEVVEVKSRMTKRLDVWRIKRNLFEALYLADRPTWRLTVID